MKDCVYKALFISSCSVLLQRIAKIAIFFFFLLMLSFGYRLFDLMIGMHLCFRTCFLHFHIQDKEHFNSHRLWIKVHFFLDTSFYGVFWWSLFYLKSQICCQNLIDCIHLWSWPCELRRGTGRQAGLFIYALV